MAKSGDYNRQSFPTLASGRFQGWNDSRLGGALFGTALVLSGCEASVLDPARPVRAAEWTMLLDPVAVMLAIIGPIIVATIAFAWWYRASNPKADHRPDWAYRVSSR